MISYDHRGTRRTTAKAKAANSSLAIFIVAIILALAITVTSASPAARVLAFLAVVPIIAVCVALLYYCRLGRPWSFAGASVLGAIGVALRLVISTRPSLEVGGGLPLPITVVYVALGISVSLTNCLSYLELRKRERSSGPHAYTL